MYAPFSEGYPVNVALGQTASRSLGRPIAAMSEPYRSIDGSIATGYDARGGYVDIAYVDIAYVTLKQPATHWWAVRLSQSLNIGHIVIYGSVASK